jgi:N-acetylglucosamine-6-phosphate deacetylase
MDILIKNAIVVFDEGVRKINHIVISNGKISDISDDAFINRQFACVIDANGLYLSSGFIDIHCHGNSGFDIMDGNEEGFHEIASYQLKQGTTAFLGATISADKKRLVGIADKISNYVKSQKQDVSELLGLYLEGPYFNSEKRGAHPSDALRLPNITEVKKLLDASSGVIKVVSLAPELEGSFSLIEYLVDNKTKVAIGHTMANYETANKAIDKGATIATHLFNAMTPYNHREPGVVGAVFDSTKIYAELIADKIHLHDSAIRLAITAKGTDKIARTRLGNLAGSTSTLLQQIKHLVLDLNYKIEDIIKMVTINPAKAIGVDDLLGSVACKKQADLVLFDDKLEIVHVIKKGVLIF